MKQLMNKSNLKLDISHPCDGYYIMESLILAQNERWRRVLSMQVAG